MTTLGSLGLKIPPWSYHNYVLIFNTVNNTYTNLIILALYSSTLVINKAVGSNFKPVWPSGCDYNLLFSFYGSCIFNLKLNIFGFVHTYIALQQCF